jgi:8-oxo-dGTP pyrophosphatase MutT (NUDIX family)
MGAGVLLSDQRGRVLLVGGIVEADESPYAAAVRELKEELGLATRVGRLLTALVGCEGQPCCKHDYCQRSR